VLVSLLWLQNEKGTAAPGGGGSAFSV